MCDSAKAIYNVNWSFNNLYKFLPPDANIIFTHCNLITNIDIQWFKGHQDQDDTKYISYKAHLPNIQLNIECNEIASEVNATVTQFPVDVDPYPRSGVVLMIDGARVITKYAEQFQEVFMKPGHIKLFFQWFKAQMIEDYHYSNWGGINRESK